MIKSSTSIKMFVILHRLMITSSAPSLWYKDQGGKENCIELPLSLYDSNNNIVKTRRVPLKLVMHYESGLVVPRQEFLKILSPTSIGETGEVKLRVRIEEVSRGHQKQNFVIRVLPDTVKYPLNNDISPIDSTPVDVMSKPRPLPAAATTTSGVASTTHQTNANNTTIAPNANNPNITTNGGNHSRKRAKEEDTHNNTDLRPSQIRKKGYFYQSLSFFLFSYSYQC